MKTETRVVTVNITPEKKLEKSYTATEFETLEELVKFATESADNAKRVVSWYNYAADLKARSNVRADIMREAEGPDKALEKQAKALFELRSKGPKPITIERAREITKALLDAE